MKKILFFIVCVAFAFSANAQSKKTPTSIPEKAKAKPELEMQNATVNQTIAFPSYYKSNTVVNAPVPMKTQKSAGNWKKYDEWIYSTEFAACILGANAFWGNGGNDWSMTYVLFPDSLGIMYTKIDGTSKPDSGFRSGQYPGIGFIFDPYSKTADEERTKRLFGNDNGEICAYRLDTLGIMGDYRVANYDPAHPDTLRIYLTNYNAYHMPDGKDLTPDPNRNVEYLSYYWTSNGANFITPTVEFERDNYGDIPQKGGVTKPFENPYNENPHRRVIDYVLKAKDTSENSPGYMYARHIDVDLTKPEHGGEPYVIPVGHIMGVVVKFIPGYDYNLDDTIKKVYYNASMGSTTNIELRNNVFSIPVIADTVFHNFHDMGGGYNSRFMETKNVRYNMNMDKRWVTDNNGNLPNWWPDTDLDVYEVYYYAIPYVRMFFSVDDFEPWYHGDDAVTEANSIVSKIFPNPATNLLKVELINSGAAELKILNTVGQVVKIVSLNEIDNSIDISSLSSGMYMLKVSQNGTTYTTKISKK